MARTQFVRKLKIMTERDITDGIAVGQVMPGAVFVDFVAYLGFLFRRVRGAFAAMLLFVMPSFLLMVVLSFLYLRYGELPMVRIVLHGLSSIMIALIIKVIIDIYTSGVKSSQYLLISVLALILLLFDVNIAIILGVGVISAVASGLYSKQLVWEKGKVGVPKLSMIMSYIVAHSWVMWVIVALIVANAAIYFFSPKIAIMDGILFKIGLLTFGNGYTMLPFVYKEAVQNFHWLTTKEFSDGIVMGQITPGPVIITATFVGYKVAGLIGAVTATLSIFLPSTMLVALVSETFVRYKDSRWAEFALKGILASFIGLLALVVGELAKANVSDYKTALIALTAIVLFVYTKINPVVLLLIGIFASLIFLR
jgi:chromate transporter